MDFESEVADLANVYRSVYPPLFRQFKIPYDESKLGEYASLPIDELFERHYNGCPCKYRDFVMTFMSLFDAHFTEASIRPGISEKIAAKLETGCRIGIISSGYEAHVHSFLSLNGLEGRVSAVVGIERTAIPWPDPYALNLCMAEMGADPGMTVLVSRNPLKVAMSEKAGIDSVSDIEL